MAKQLSRRLILARVAVVTDSLGRTWLIKAGYIYYNQIRLSTLFRSRCFKNLLLDNAIPQIYKITQIYTVP